MSDLSAHRTEKKELPPQEPEPKKTQVIVGNLELLQVQLLSDISGKLDKLLEKKNG